MMVQALFLLCLLVWLPILFHQITNRGFQVLILWLLIAPIAINVMQRPNRNPFFRVSGSPEPLLVTNEQKDVPLGMRQSGYFSSSVSFSWKDVVEPTRLLLFTFFLLFLLESRNGKSWIPLDKTEMWMGIFSLVLMLNVFLFTRRYTYGIRVAIDAFMVPFLAYYTMRRFIVSEVQLRLFTKMFCFLGSYLIILALAEKLARSGVSVNNFYRLKGPFDHRDLLYIVLVVVFMVVLSEISTGQFRLHDNSTFLRYARWFVAALAPLVIFFTWTRGNWLGFLSGTWFFFFLGRRLLPFSRKLICLSLILLIIPVGVLGLQAALTENVLENRVAKTSTFFARWESWRMLVEETLKQPIFGVGLNNSRDVLQHRRLSQYADVKSLTTPHNGFLAIFAELGVVGLIAYAAIIICMARLGLRLYRSGTSVQARWGGIAILAILVAYYMPVLTENILHAPELSHVYVFGCVGGIVGCYAKTLPRPMPRTSIPTYAPRRAMPQEEMVGDR
jgi:O-antigen ligase